MKVSRKAISGAVGTMMLAATTVVASSPPAAAADSFSFEYVQTDWGYVINVVNNNWRDTAGRAVWTQDPSGSQPGDALSVNDELPDGYGIEAHLSTGRIATTRGHKSPYSTTVTGNLPEDQRYSMRVCAVKGSFSKCSSKVSVYS
ncbi:hypothetical protein ACQPZG_05025 (plasmid) [Streptomyces sp. CA-294286]|uniref:hypothetical protein n=1 Tax=Streptomyces sp. CA-294286 TaxID=3240070 RepID=UPI003D8B2305